MEGSNGDFGRGNSHDNNQGTQPMTSTRETQPIQQDDEWSVPPAVERRDDVGRQQVTQTPPSSPSSYRGKTIYQLE